MAPSFELERKFYAQGFSLVAGVDEAGRGPLAGPVVAGAVIFPGSLFSSPHSNGQPDRAWLDKVDDSKALSHRQRLEALGAYPRTCPCLGRRSGHRAGDRRLRHSSRD